MQVRTTQGIDYLRCSFDAPLFVVRSYLDDWLGSEWIESNGRHGYRRALTAPNGAVLYADGHLEGMGCCLELSGAPCGVVGDMKGFMAVLLDQGARVSRLDVALDVEGSGLSVGTIRAACAAGSVVSRARSDKWSVKEDFGAYGGWLCSFGSRSSDSYLRIYNKAAEQELTGDWVRFELELKNERAKAMAHAYAYGDLESDPFIVRSIAAMFDVRLGEQVNKSNRRRAEWLDAIYNGVRAGALNITRRIYIIRQAAWVERQVPAMLAAFVEVFGPNTIGRLLEEGRSRWKAKHRLFVRSFQCGYAQVGS